MGGVCGESDTCMATCFFIHTAVHITVMMKYVYLMLEPRNYSSDHITSMKIQQKNQERKQ